MSGLDSRQAAFEAKFKHDEELRFRVNTHTSKIFGLWAAEQLGLSGDEAEAYAKIVVEADFEEAGSDDVLRKVSSDFDEKGVAYTEHLLKAEFDIAHGKAKEITMTELDA